MMVMTITDKDLKMIIEQQPAPLKVDLVCWAGQAKPDYDGDDDHDDAYGGHHFDSKSFDDFDDEIDSNDD